VCPDHDERGAFVRSAAVKHRGSVAQLYSNLRPLLPDVAGRGLEQTPGALPLPLLEIPSNRRRQSGRGHRRARRALLVGVDENEPESERDSELRGYACRCAGLTRAVDAAYHRRALGRLGTGEPVGLGRHD